MGPVALPFATSLSPPLVSPPPPLQRRQAELPATDHPLNEINRGPTAAGTDDRVQPPFVSAARLPSPRRPPAPGVIRPLTSPPPGAPRLRLTRQAAAAAERNRISSVM